MTVSPSALVALALVLLAVLIIGLPGVIAAAAHYIYVVRHPEKFAPSTPTAPLIVPVDHMVITISPNAAVTTTTCFPYQHKGKPNV